ncbi:MAG TPA: ThiF family adenylyltransferase [Mycobacteriales bacterium]
MTAVPLDLSPPPVPPGPRPLPERRCAVPPSRLGGRPMLPPALRTVWRSGSALQLGLDPARAVVLDGVDEPLVRALLDLDGTRTEPEVLAAAADAGVDPLAFGAVLTQLRAGGLLAEAGPGTAARGSPAADAVRTSRAFGAPAAAGRLGPDLASLSLLEDAAAPLDVLRRRRRATVLVHGAGRVGVGAATLLAAAGVGRVHVADRGPVRPGDVAPGGFTAADVDRSRSGAAAEALRRAAPEAQTGPAPPGRRPELVLLAGADPVGGELRGVLHAGRVPHLPAGVRETTAVVGPLVVPGLTSCLRCADLHRTDRDPAWPVVAAQLAGVRRRREEPCDVVLASVAASVAALQSLALLDGRPAAAAGATLELALSDGRLRRRRWAPHRRCGCGAGTLGP